MTNLIILIGKVSEVDLDKNSFDLIVQRPYRDNQGSFQSDHFICESWRGMNSYMSSYINKDDTILVKGRLETKDSKQIVKVESFSLIHRTNKKISA